MCISLCVREKDFLNAAACINNYMSATFDELVRNNNAFLEKNADSGTIFVLENIHTGEKFRVSGNQLFKNYCIRPARVIDRNLQLREVSAIALENDD